MKQFNAYDHYGTFKPELWYYLTHGIYPSKLKYHPDDEIDVNKISKSFIYEIFPDVSFYKENFTLIKDDSVHTENHLMKVLECIYVESNNILYSIDDNGIIVYYKYNDYDELYLNIIHLWEKFPKKEEEVRAATVKFMDIQNGEYYTTEEDIKPFTIDIEENYNSDFLPVWEDIINFINSPGSGLILMSGYWGTGKSSLIKHLITNYPKNYVIIPNGIACRLGEPELNSFIRSCKNSVFILEDCEQILSDRKNNPFNSGIANILNMSDGIASDTFNIKFICTFNAELQDIDPALTRKGRCFANYVFKELEEDKVRILNEKYNLNLPEIKAMTLADIYHAKQRTMDKINKPKKIGF